MKDEVEFLERRRDLLRTAVKDSRAIEVILRMQGKQLEHGRQRQITLDAEAELMEAEAEIYRVAAEDGANTRLSLAYEKHGGHESPYSDN